MSNSPQFNGNKLGKSKEFVKLKASAREIRAPKHLSAIGKNLPLAFKIPSKAYARTSAMHKELNNMAA